MLGTFAGLGEGVADGRMLDLPEVAERLNAALPRCTIHITGKDYEPSDPHFREVTWLLSKGVGVSVRLADGKDVTPATLADVPDAPRVECCRCR